MEVFRDGFPAVFVVAVICLAAGIGVGIWMGTQLDSGSRGSDAEALNASYVNRLVEEANETGFRQGYRKARRENSRIIAVEPDGIVRDVAAYRIDGYMISLETGHNNSYLREYEWSGYTWKNGSIVLRSGMTLTWTFDTCRHEVKHNLYPDLGHEELRKKSSRQAKRVCLKLVSLID